MCRLIYMASYYVEEKPNSPLWGVRTDRHKWVPGAVFGTETQAQQWIDQQASQHSTEDSARPSTRRVPPRERNHPLGAAVESGPGCTVYEDTSFNGGRVTIYDRS